MVFFNIWEPALILMHGLCCIYLAHVLTFCVVGESHKPLLRGSGLLAVGNMFDFDVVLFAGSQSVCYMHQWLTLTFSAISPPTIKHQKILMGDFNINIQNKHINTTEKNCKCIGTNQLINNPTTKQNTIIDHIHTNLTEYHSTGVIKTYYSDHDQIYITLK